MIRLATCLPILLLLAACAKPSNPAPGAAAPAVPVAPGAPPAKPVVVVEPSCADRQAAAFNEFKRDQYAWYAGHGLNLPNETNSSQFFAGTSGQTEVIVHGLISSPAAMQAVADGFIKRGDTVIIPLLTGFGVDGKAANASTEKDWQAAVHDSLKLAAMCSNHTTVIAHSLGAAMVSEELLHNGASRITHLELLSPYFKVDQPAIVALIALIKDRVDVLDLPTIQKLTGGIDPYTWLPLDRPQAGEAAPYFPMIAINRVLAIEKDFELKSGKLIDGFSAVKIPTLTVVSEADEVIDPSYAITFSTTAYEDVQEIIYPKGLGVGHSLELPATNSQFAQLETSLIAFTR